MRMCFQLAKKNCCTALAFILILLAQLVIAPLPLAHAGAILQDRNVRITDAGAEDARHIDMVRIAEHEGKLYAVWEDNRDDETFGVYFARSTDGGKTWSANIRVSDWHEDHWSNMPDIAVQPDGTIWIVWHQYYDSQSNMQNDIRVAKSTDGGVTFQVSDLANGFDRDSDLWKNRIVVDKSTGGVYILSHLYGSDTDSEGFNPTLLRYDATNDEWYPTLINDVMHTGRIHGSGYINDYGPWISLDARDGLICAVWEDRGRHVDERKPIYGACSTDGGVSFGPNFLISADDNVRPEIAIGPDGELYVIYTVDAESQHNIRLRRSTDQGATWSDAILVTNVDSLKVRQWEMSVDANGQLLIVFVRDLLSRSDLYLATSVDQGANFSLIRLEDDQGSYPDSADQFDPSLAVGGTGESTYAYIAWKDDRNIDREIWFQRALLDGIPPTAPTNLATAAAERAVILTWNASEDATGISGYRVYRSTSKTGPFVELTVRNAPTTTYVDVELDATTYFYRVAAIDNTGNTGPVSAVISGAAQAADSSPIQGTIAYEVGNNVHIRNLAGAPNERTLTDATQPRFSGDGSRLYFRTGGSIFSQPVAGGTPELYLAVEGLSDYDLSGTESHYAGIVYRQLVAPGAVGGFCSLFEPTFGRPGQTLYTSQYDYGSEVALSADQRWLAYRTAGFCNVAGSGAYIPPKLCLVDLASSSEDRELCLDGYDYRTPDFAPSGSWLVFAAPFTGQDEIWKAQIQEDGTLVNYVQLTRGPEGQKSRSPSWSSDGKWIVFQRDVLPGVEEQWQLFAVRADGVGGRALGLDGERPAWLGGGSGEQPPIVGADQIFLPLIAR